MFLLLTSLLLGPVWSFPALTPALQGLGKAWGRAED